MSGRDSEREIQQAYYATGGGEKLDPPEGVRGEHDLALAMLLGFLSWAPAKSLLDVGAGTGRNLVKIGKAFPNLELTGIDPSPELRQVSVERWGLKPGQISDGDATRMPFADQSVDIVTSFGILHHIKDHAAAVAEMARVARVAVFISDVNCFGQGNKALRMLKHAMHSLGLWNASVSLRSGGKGYFISEGDGLYYSYSLIDDLPILNKRFEHVMVSNLMGQSTDHYRDSPRIVVCAHNETPSP
jgi:SAM-dependent methyltransferase